MSAEVNTTLAIMDGHIEDAKAMGESIRARGEEAGISRVSYGMSIPGIRAQTYLGDSLEALVQEIPSRRPSEAFSLPCLLLAHLGRNEEASEILESNVVKRSGIGTFEDEIESVNYAMFLEASVLVGHKQAAELLVNRFSGTGIYTTGLFCPTCILRHLGGAATLMGRYDEARKYYQEAIKVCTEMRFRPELALSRLQLAELLLEHYPDERSEALEHLDFAIKEFREMKMQPSLERALRHKDILKA
jgi:tetratricopeptide (TPR) repeat protein